MIASLFDTSTALVTTLNPWIGSDCDSGLWSQISGDGYVQVCVEAVSGVTVTPTSTTPTTTTTSTTSETSATPPAESQPGATTDCSLWHVVKSGDGCQTIAGGYGISLEDFYTWNPGVGSDCSTLWLGYAVCVAI
ncbi:hypothetical protein BDV12DRAFT_209352 [Aspergillus spectabilis]